MKKGYFSLIVYGLIVCLGIFLFAVGYLDATRTSAGSGYSDMPITHIIGMVLIAIGIIPFVLKLLHMVKGWKLCDVLCIFIDIAVAGFVVSYIILPGTAQGESILFLIPLVVSLGALISNVKSIKN